MVGLTFMSGLTDEPAALAAVDEAEDEKLMNLIAETAKKSSYNNSMRQGLEKQSSTRSVAGAAAARQRRPRGCCGGGAGDVVAASAAVGDGVLRDPSSSASYDVLHLVGEGGFSKVLLVRAKSGHVGSGGPASPRSAKDVFAAKIIPKAHLKAAGETFMKATMLEKDVLSEFDSPFLIKLYHSFQERDKLVLVIDYCPGGSLHTHVNISLREDGDGFGESRAAFYAAEIALGLAHLHGRGIVHRDLKLENVLMRADGHCAVSDFGASKRLRPVDARLRRAGNMRAPADRDDAAAAAEADLPETATSIVGTPAYMAPEMLLAQAYGFSVDWWALGVLLFTMLKGRLPFDASDEDKMLWRIVKSKPRYDPAWSPEVTAVLRALLQKRPATRLSDLTTLGAAPLYAAYDWVKMDLAAAPPPYVPSLAGDADQAYIPKKLGDAPFTLQDDAYKKGASMRAFYRGFSDRQSLEGDGRRPAAAGTQVAGPPAPPI